MQIRTPGIFSFDECLRWLGRSDLEPTFRVIDGHLLALIPCYRRTLTCEIHGEPSGQTLSVHFRGRSPTVEEQRQVHDYITAWFDLDRDLSPFYRLAEKDALLAPLIDRFYGLRVIGIPRMFEALSWAVIGQQINLSFAYRLKGRLCELYGITHAVGDAVLHEFPSPERIAGLDRADLLRLQFSRQKADYLTGVAREVQKDPWIDPASALWRDMERARECLLALRGVGEWTAEYVMMKCLRHTSALPAGDAGLQNALRQRLNMDRKPTEEEIRKIANGWRNWEAYATFYLWRTLL